VYLTVAREFYDKLLRDKICKHKFLLNTRRSRYPQKSHNTNLMRGSKFIEVRKCVSMFCFFCRINISVEQIPQWRRNHTVTDRNVLSLSADGDARSSIPLYIIPPTCRRDVESLSWNPLRAVIGTGIIIITA
jgi:hypothetical protein